MSPRSEQAGYVRVKDRLAYYGKGKQDLVGTLQRIIADPSNKFVQKIVFEVGVPYVYLEKLLPEEEAGPAAEASKVSLHDAIRTQPIEEYVAEENRTPVQQLWDVFHIIHQEGFEAGFILIGSKSKFQKWLDVRIPTTDMRVFGVPLEVSGELPQDTYIVCGTPDYNAEHDDVKFSVKGTI